MASIHLKHHIVLGPPEASCHHRSSRIHLKKYVLTSSTDSPFNMFKALVVNGLIMQREINETNAFIRAVNLFKASATRIGNILKRYLGNAFGKSAQVTTYVCVLTIKSLLTSFSSCPTNYNRIKTMFPMV